MLNQASRVRGEREQYPAPIEGLISAAHNADLSAAVSVIGLGKMDKEPEVGASVVVGTYDWDKGETVFRRVHLK
jgi:hypothetical protein